MIKAKILKFQFSFFSLCYMRYLCALFNYYDKCK